MGKCRGMSTDFNTVLKYAKRKYRCLGHFTIMRSAIKKDWFVVPYSDIKPSDVVTPYVFDGRKWQEIIKEGGC